MFCAVISFVSLVYVLNVLYTLSACQLNSNSKQAITIDWG